MDNEFINLHVHSDYSILDGMCSIDKLFPLAKELSQKALAITDHGNLDGYVRALKKSWETGVKYIPAVEFYIADDIHNLNKESRFKHLCIYAKNKKGLSELFSMLAKANEYFYRKPVLDFNSLRSFNHSNLIMSTACTAGMLSYTDYDKKIKYMLDNFTDKLYLEIMPHSYQEQFSINQRAVDLSKKYHLKLLATSDAHYLYQKQNKSHEVMLAVNTNDKMSNPNRYKFGVDTCFFTSKKDMQRLFKKQNSMDIEDYTKAIRNTNHFYDLVDFDSFKKQSINIQLDNYDINDFYAIIKKRFKKKNFDREDIYKKRLSKEWKLIVEKGFDKYFYIVYDFIKYANSQNITVGPGRGSVGGSLLAYVLGITRVDPIKFGLSFRRFIDKNRNDLPDIDIDFEDARREEIVEYLKIKYGKNQVINISTFVELKARAVIKDVSRVCELDYMIVNNLTQTMDEISSTSLKAQAIENKQLKEFIKEHKQEAEYMFDLENIVKSTGVHAAGHVISNQDVNKSGAGYIVKRKRAMVLNWDKDDAEFMGFIKFDLLGLNTLTILSNAARYIKEKYNKTIIYDNINIEDKKVLDLFQKGDTTGVFQFSSYGMKKLLKSTSINTFKDLVNLNALFRPGALRSGIAEEYINVSNGNSIENYYDLDFYEKATKDTHGLIVYQEQLTKILIGFGFTYSEADMVRKVVSKSKGLEEIAKYEEKFIKSAKDTLNWKLKDAKQLWEKIKFFAGYAFNLSHSVEYTLIAFWTAYLKLYYYDEFFQALLSYSQEEKLPEFINDLIACGYEIHKIDINKSKSIEYVVKNKQVFLPFMAVKGIGDKSAKEIEQARFRIGNIANTITLYNNVDKRAVNSRVIKLLEKAGAFSEDYDRSVYKINI